MKRLLTELRASLAATAFLIVVLCGLYPLIVWCAAQGIFHDKANGSLVVEGGRITGSRLIGRQCADPRCFHPRPSAAGAGYDATMSGGSNLGPTSKKLIAEIGRLVEEYRAENGLGPADLVPADAVTASALSLIHI